MVKCKKIISLILTLLFICSSVPFVYAEEVDSSDINFKSIDTSSLQSFFDNSNLSHVADEILSKLVADCSTEEFCNFFYRYDSVFAEYADASDFSAIEDAFVSYADEYLAALDINSGFNEYKSLIGMVFGGTDIDLNSVDGVIGTLADIIDYLKSKPSFGGDLSKLSSTALYNGSGRNKKVISSNNSTAEEIVAAFLEFVSDDANINFIKKMIRGNLNFGTFGNLLNSYVGNVNDLFLNFTSYMISNMYDLYLKGDSDIAFEDSIFVNCTIDEVFAVSLYTLMSGETVTSVNDINSKNVEAVCVSAIENSEYYAQKYAFNLKMMYPEKLPEFTMAILFDANAINYNVVIDDTFENVLCYEISSIFSGIFTLVNKNSVNTELSGQSFMRDLLTASKTVLCEHVVHAEETIQGYAATCTETGLTDGVKCSVCDEILTAQEVIPATGHANEILLGYAATCTKAGLTDGVKCSGCGEIFKEQVVISTTGHNWVVMDTIPATCSSKGVVLYVCTNCYHCVDETIERTAHNNEQTINVKEATCTENGYTGDTYCVDCITKTAEGTIIPATGHTYDSGKVTTKATCSATGVKIYICTVCKSTKTETVAKDSNNHTGDTTIKNATSATCIAKGYTGDTYCNGCNTKLSAGTAIAAKGHTKTTVKGYAATCTKTGLTDGEKCSVCNETLTAQTTIAATGHTKTTVKGYAATCTKTGLTDGAKCSVCGEILTAQEEIPALGHAFGKWVVVKAPIVSAEGIEEKSCTVCGEKETRTVEKFNFIMGDINGDGKVTTADARLVLRVAVGLEALESYPVPLEAIDMDGNGKLATSDARTVLRKAVGLE